MSNWQKYDLDNKITQILAEVPDSTENHHLGSAYLTAYQIAIEFAQRFPEDFSALDLPVGGAGTGQHNSLAQYFAQQLSRLIKSKEIQHIEGGFLSNLHLNDISFTSDETLIHSSLTSSGFTLSTYRLSNVEPPN
jgi:hypothetical protein